MHTHQSGETFRFSSLTAAGPIGQTASAEDVAEKDAVDLLDVASAEGATSEDVTAAAARLDHQQLAALAAHLLMETVAASTALEVTARGVDALRVQVKQHRDARIATAFELGRERARQRGKATTPAR